MGVLDALLLGLVQGLTEFLPVSSSGHLVLSEHLLGVGGHQDISFEVFVHFGTVLSILAVYYKDILALLRSAVLAATHPAKIPEQYQNDASFRMVAQIIVSAIPAGIVGVMFEKSIETAFTDPKLVSTMLIVTGLLLFLTRLFRTKQTRPMSMPVAILVGIAQAFAIIPGISRSGSTISMALYNKVDPQEAARFSFLMSVPVILGATLLKALEMVRTGSMAVPPEVLAVGTLAACITGYAAIRVLLRILAGGRIRIFAFYCLAAGIAGILFLS